MCVLYGGSVAGECDSPALATHQLQRCCGTDSGGSRGRNKCHRQRKIRHLILLFFSYAFLIFLVLSAEFLALCAI
jgi:hypothetical protein